MGHTMVVGYDGSKMADAALDTAIALAKSGYEWQITVVCGEDRPAEWTGHTFKGIFVDSEEWLQQWREKVEADMAAAVKRVEEAGVKAASACTRDEPVDLILNVAHDVGAELIVIGASGAGGVVDVIMGSTAMRVLHRSDIPVLIVPAAKS